MHVKSMNLSMPYQESSNEDRMNDNVFFNANKQIFTRLLQFSTILKPTNGQIDFDVFRNLNYRKLVAFEH